MFTVEWTDASKARSQSQDFSKLREALIFAQEQQMAGMQDVSVVDRKTGRYLLG